MMGKKLQTIFELLGANDEEIDEVLSYLTCGEKKPLEDEEIERLARIAEEEMQDSTEDIILEILKEQEETEKIDMEFRLLQLIGNKKTNIQICKKLGIETDELYRMLIDLKIKGRQVEKKYFSNGVIRYDHIKSLDKMDAAKNGFEKTIYSSPDVDNIKFLLISDLHFGSNLERPDLVDSAFAYCRKHGIHIIICGGDFIEGASRHGKKHVSSVEKQLQFFMDRYPHDDHILTFGVAGNHDASAIKAHGINIIDLFDNYRPDIILGDFGGTKINIKNDHMYLYHSVPGREFMHTGSPIVIHGHAHTYKLTHDKNNLNIVLPALCNINTFVPSALELEINFRGGYFGKTKVKQIYFDDEMDFVFGEAEFNLSRGKCIDENAPIKNEESLGRTKKLH